MPDSTLKQSAERLSRLENLVQTAQDSLTAKLEDILDSSVAQSLPDELRFPWIKSAASQIAYHYLHKPDQDIKPDQEAISAQLNSVIETLKDSNHPLSSFIPPQTKQLIIDSLQSANLSQFQQAQQAAFEARFLREQQPVSSQITAKTLLDQIPDDQEFGLTQNDTEAILVHLRNQSSVINNPTKTSLQAAIEAIITNPNQLNLHPDIAQNFGQQLLKDENLDQIHHYILSATDPLPQATPLAPHTQVITPKDLRQAKALKVSPLALSYTKSGFSADDPKLSKDLKNEIKQIQAFINDPFSTQNNLSLSGQLTATLLKPQVKLSQAIYHPVYQKLENLKAKTNQVFLKPFTLYKAAQEKYQSLKQHKTFGWLVAPRARYHLSINNLKLGLTRKLKHQAIKTQSRRRLYRGVNRSVSSVKSFWGKWSPRGIKRRTGDWVKRKSISLTAKTGEWLLKKGLAKGLGKILIKAAELSTAATGIGAPLVILKWVIGLGIASFKKLRNQIKKDRDELGTFDLAYKVVKTILTGLKSLGMALFGTVWGIAGGIAGAAIGAMIGTAILPGIGTAIGAVVGFIGGSLTLGSIGALIGYNWMAIAAIPAAIGTFFFGANGLLGGGLTGIGAAKLAGATTGIAMGTTLGATTLINIYQDSVVKSAFLNPFLPEDSLHQKPSNPTSYECALSDQPAPAPANIVYSNDGQYAFPVPPVHSYGCTHWGDTNTAADIFVATSANDQIVANPVVAYHSGTISWVEHDHEHAGINLAIAGSDGRNYYYSHNCAIYVKVGDHVSAGQVVATTDKTGVNAAITPEHLHFEIYESGSPVCAQQDFEEKFQLNKCSPAQQCAAP